MKAAIAVLALGLALGACSNDEEGRGDSPVDQHNINDAPAYIINFPDQFHNVAVKCDPHGFRIFSHTRSGAPPVIMRDDTCLGQERGQR